MANNVSNVTASKPGIGGAIWTAPLGTPLPTSASAPLSSAYESLGYLSEDGLSHNVNMSTSQTKAWGGDVVLNSQTEKNHTYGFAALEAMNGVVLRVVYGDSNVSGTLSAGMTVKLNNDELTERVWVFDEILRGNVLKRTVIARGSISEISEISDNDTDPIAYGLTLLAMPDAALDGDSAKELYLDPSSAQSGIEISEDTITIDEGGTATVKAQLIGGDADVTWTSSSASVAAVAGSTLEGKPIAIITGIGEGTATITASATIGGSAKTDTVTVTVTGGE